MPPAECGLSCFTYAPNSSRVGVLFDRRDPSVVASLLMGRPYVLPEGVSSDRVKILQDSFMASMKDPGLIEDATKLKLEINALDGQGVHDLLFKMYSTPQTIIDKVTAIFVPEAKK